jgi:DNA repair exonuclease SbcCD nuclease subunit
MTSSIIIGDTHFKIDNTVEVDIFIDKVITIIEENLPDFVVLLGDTLDTHERVHTTPLNRAYKFITGIKKLSKVFVLVGNHDYQNNQQYLTDNHWLNGMKEWENVVIVDKVISEIINEQTFIFCPYVPNGRFQEALNTLDVEWKEATCIFAHQEFKNCKMGAFNSIDGDEWKVDFPNIISGHIHLNQKPQDNIYYPGSSLPVAFGESNKNIIAYVEFGKGNYNLEEINLGLPKKKIFYINAEDVDNYVIPDTEDKIKLSISGVYEDFKSFKKTKKYKEILNKGIKVTFKPKRVEVKKKKETLQDNIENNTNDFNIIIKDIVEQERNSYLFEAYEMVVNSKQIQADDILFL